MNLPDRVAFTIPGLNIPIYWYAVLITLGIVLAVVAATYFAKKRKMPVDTAVDLCLWAVPIGFICARIYYVLFSLSEYHSFVEMINIRNGGLAIPGGIIGGLLGVCIYSLIKKKRILGYLDIMVPGVALAQAIGRWGNFFNQEAYGTAVTKFLYFPFVVRIEDCGCDLAAQGIRHGHLATFFYESMFCIIIFITLLLLSRKQKRTGDLMLTYICMYTGERMILEHFRTDALMMNVFGLNVRVTQVLCAVLFLATVVYFIVRAVYENRHGKLLLPIIEDEYCDPHEEPHQPVQEQEQEQDIDPSKAMIVEAEEDDTLPGADEDQ